ncbi:MAG: hypothetical protein WC327_06610 [Candidatus Cloacimonadia bacterium]
MSDNSKEYVAIDPAEDKRSPEKTKEYMLSKGYRPYRSPSGKIRWLHPSSAIFRKYSRNKNNAFYVYDQFDNRHLRPWIKRTIFVGTLVIVIAILIFRFRLYEYFI